MQQPDECTSLPDLVRRTVLASPDAPALTDMLSENEFKTYSYQEFWDAVLRVAGQLLKRGVEAGDRVGILADGRSWWPIADLAILSVGAVTVPIYPSIPSNQVQHIVRHSGMRGIFVENAKQLAKLAEALNAERYAASESATDVVSEAARAEVGLCEFIVQLDGAIVTPPSLPADYQLYSDWLNETVSTATEALIEQRMQALQRTNMATIVYTSGTTGVPKGVQLSHANLLANLSGIRAVVPLQATDRTLSYLPLSHIFERTCGQFAVLMAGAQIVYSRGFRYMSEDFLLMPPTILTTVPRLLEKVEEAARKEALQSKWKHALFERAVRNGAAVRVDGKPQGMWFSLYDRAVLSRIRAALGGRIRFVVVGGAPMARQTGQFMMAAGVVTVEGYGMTETSPVVAVNSAEAPRLGTVGKVIPNVDIRFASDGELLVRGESVTSGYYLDEAATAEAFDGEWLKTGDIGELDTDGYLKIVDRKKNLLVLSTGKKVTPAPLESDIMQSPYIDYALLLGQNRKFVTVLIAPAEEAIETYLKQLGVNVARELWSTNKAVMDLLEAEVRTRTASYANFERPKKILLADAPFSIDNGLLTPTLKPRGKQILAAYSDAIQHMYEQAESQSAEG
ncbi:long-chain fatty acid--CoA ligase [Alicyclobacillus sp. SP_1]|jgi:long-chain acyl-CoA synthetase|uniref:AMP-dependent synthetase/ligase n=1 Tax=Alicyclobacillus sp. SP_1 TaxID=2942475 RepID=UPI002157B7D2|nr:long-chain fatty acid--CoA ligase [Alicyclobacillus sp. SP_1]